jgi:leucyl aminopeptidase
MLHVEFVVVEPSTWSAAGSAAVVAFESNETSPGLDSALALSEGHLARCMSAAGMTGKSADKSVFHAVQGVGGSAVAVIGAGVKSEWSDSVAELVGAETYRSLKGCDPEATLHFGGATAEQAARAAFAAILSAYRFDTYRTKEKPEAKPKLGLLKLATDDPEAAKLAFAPWQALAEAVIFARNLTSEPANELYPAEFAHRVKGLSRLGLTVEVLGEEDMAKLGMHSLLGVGQGSERESQLVIMTWMGAQDPTSAPVALVGKGVCFDTGGISLKPADGMEDMKWDMGGAAAVTGAMMALAGRKAKANVVGILGLVENMPDGRAQRPGDVVRSMSGQTIEVINTDAEGRLVLADAIWYCQERFKPRALVDLATLTGAIIIALGHDYAGMFSNDDELSEALANAGTAEREKLWRLPLPDSYEKQIESAIADMKNVGGRPGGSITAALFIKRFVRDIPWAHLDIAATAWRKPSTEPTVPDGATGFGVRLLNRLIADTYEDK